MFAANTYVIRHLQGAEPLSGPALVGEIDGRPAAAISLTDGRVVANPFQPTANLVAQLRMRARAMWQLERTPELSKRLRAAVRTPALA
jgi:hypothetical protein